MRSHSCGILPAAEHARYGTGVLIVAQSGRCSDLAARRVELGVGHLRAGEGHGEGVRGPGRLRLEQLRQRHLRYHPRSQPSWASIRLLGRMSVQFSSMYSRQLARESVSCATVQPSGVGWVAGHRLC